MDPSTLERLLTDREVGELSADTAALLNAYLETCAPEQTGESQIRSAISLARIALAQAASDPTPALPPLRLATRRKLRLAGSGYLAAAAAIALAFFIGTRTPNVAIPTVNTPQTSVRLASTSEDFWSIERLRQTARPSNPQHKTLNWTSPLSVPQPGEGS